MKSGGQLSRVGNAFFCEDRDGGRVVQFPDPREGVVPALAVRSGGSRLTLASRKLRGPRESKMVTPKLWHSSGVRWKERTSLCGHLNMT